MSAVVKGKAPIRPPNRPPVQRLASLKNPRPRISEPIKSALRQTPANSGAPTCTNPVCGQSEVTSEDGNLVCQNCGTVVRDDHITSEVTFGETASGAAVLQGSHVGADQAYTQLSAPGGSKITGGQDSRKIAENNARHFIEGLCGSFKLSRMYSDHAMQYYKLCLTNNLVQGRDSRHVACVCLYIACRRSKESDIMLIDFVPVLKINVFFLGRTYQKIVKALMIQRNGVIDAINPENLIYRFAKKLEFGQDMYRVARDACQVLQRMDRDWITVGRRPAGVCGAAIIIAARMNNYRRNTREVTYIVKVADVTILQRLDEFKKTRASQMTVSEFRNHSHTLAEAHDPPAYSRQFEKKQKRRVRRRLETGTAADEQSESGIDSDEEETAASENSDPESRRESSSKQKGRKRTHSQVQQSPAIPIDPALISAGEPSADQPGPSTSQDPNQRISEIVEEEIVANPQVAEDSDDIPTSRNPTPGKGKGKARAKSIPDPNQPALTVGAKRKRGRPPKDNTLAATSTSPSPTKRPTQTPRATSQLPIASDTLATILEEGDAQEESSSAQARAADQAAMPPPPRRAISDSPDIGDEEFANDAEVNNCLLTEAETMVKERIWLHENGEYLRAQEAKRIKRELAEANGTIKEVKKRKRKRGRLGDASQYHTVNEDGTVSGPATPAEAVEMMMRQRAFSKKINYEAVEKLYGGPVKDRADAKEGSPSAGAAADKERDADVAGEQARAGKSPAAEELDRLAADFGEENDDPDPDEEGDYDEND